MSSYLLLNKPKGVITSTRGAAGRRTVLDFIPFSLQREQRWYAVGLLDGDSTGLVLLTDDGVLARQLDHPKLGLSKEYRALCTGLAGDEQLQQLRAGMYLVNLTVDGSKTTQRAAMESVRILKRHVDRARGDRTLLGLTVRARRASRDPPHAGARRDEAEGTGAGRSGTAAHGGAEARYGEAAREEGCGEVERGGVVRLKPDPQAAAMHRRQILALWVRLQPDFFSIGRTSPSCATVATNLLSRSNICARVSPRAPPANGLTASISIQSSARQARWNHIA